MTDIHETQSQEIDHSVVSKIYSRKAIIGFSIFFSPIFGGVLLRQNLVDSKNRKAANIVLLFSISFTVLTIFIVNSFEEGSKSLTYLLNIIGGSILSEIFFKKYFQGDNYEYKKIWKALIISLLIITPFILAMIYFPS